MKFRHSTFSSRVQIHPAERAEVFVLKLARSSKSSGAKLREVFAVLLCSVQFPASQKNCAEVSKLRYRALKFSICRIVRKHSNVCTVHS